MVQMDSSPNHGGPSGNNKERRWLRTIHLYSKWVRIIVKSFTLNVPTSTSCNIYGLGCQLGSGKIVRMLDNYVFKEFVLIIF